MTDIVLPSRRYVEIEDIANGLILNTKNVTPPYNLEDIAKNLNIELVKISSLPTEKRNAIGKKLLQTESDAFLVATQKFTKIILNDLSYPETRIYFTTAHEIGHAVLGHAEHSALAEFEANVFARCLITPYGVLRTFDLRAINALEIADIFHVSLSAAQYCERRTFSRLAYYDENSSESTILLSNRFKEYLKGGVM